MTSISEECDFRDHEWSGKHNHEGNVDVTLSMCARCGVGHELRFMQVGTLELEAKLRIFPPRGATTISRAVIQYTIMTTEVTISEAIAQGFTVKRQFSRDGEPVGEGLGMTFAMRP
jgi:hypothetical protein